MKPPTTPADHPATGAAPAAARARWMSTLAAAQAEELAATALPWPDDACWLRRPHTGLVMVRARTGGTGPQFNLGEVAVTRCALRLADGTVGLAYVRGRDTAHAQRAALLDARLQQAQARGELDAALARWIAPLDATCNARRAAQQARAQTTRVDFFTVVRGENE